MRQCIDWLLRPEVRAETQEEDEVAGAHPSAVIRYKNRGATGKAAETADLSSEIEEEEGAQSLYECPDGSRIAKSEFFHRRLDRSLGRKELPNGSAFSGRRRSASNAETPGMLAILPDIIWNEAFSRSAATDC
jgi:hypothetical protein